MNKLFVLNKKANNTAFKTFGIAHMMQDINGVAWGSWGACDQKQKTNYIQVTTTGEYPLFDTVWPPLWKNLGMPQGNKGLGHRWT